LGGGGLSSAVGETAKRFDCGAIVELDKVPLKYTGLAPWEIYISESQERMLLTLPPENLSKAMEIFEKEDVAATVVGKLTREKRLILRHQGATVADLDMGFLFTAPPSVKAATFEIPVFKEPVFPEPDNLTSSLLQLLGAPNVASKESVIRTYDHEVKGNTALKPLQGEYAGPNDAASSNTGQFVERRAISCGMNPTYGKVDAYWMQLQQLTKQSGTT